VYKDANNRIISYMSSTNQMTFFISVAGAATFDTLSTASITAGTEYLVEIEYSATQATLSIDGAIVKTLTPVAGIDFGANIPDTFYAGSENDGTLQNDAVFS
jgi:hypothetical protein